MTNKRPEESLKEELLMKDLMKGPISLCILVLDLRLLPLGRIPDTLMQWLLLLLALLLMAQSAVLGRMSALIVLLLTVMVSLKRWIAVRLVVMLIVIRGGNGLHGCI